MICTLLQNWFHPRPYPILTQFSEIFNGPENLMSKASNYRPAVHIKPGNYFFFRKNSVNYKIKKLLSSFLFDSLINPDLILTPYLNITETEMGK